MSTRTRPVDLRSDTVTRPTPAMRRAMAEAEVGDDGYGDDPTVRALEEEVADLLGHEAAVLTPSGVMANLIGVRLSVAPGEELLAEADAHLVTYERGSLAALLGLQTRTLPGRRGALDPAAVAAALRPEGYGTVVTRLLAVEQTHVRSGGSVVPLATLDGLRALTRAAGTALHVDGARIWNAAIALGVPEARLTAEADTVAVCLSKGLGAPVGSVLACPAAAAVEARVWRGRLGGQMRQAGVIAAAGLVAVRQHRARLVEDHARARRLAEGLADGAPGCTDPTLAVTNIVLLRCGDADRVLAAASAQGVLANAVAPGVLRLVCHLDIDDDGVGAALDVLGPLLAASPALPGAESAAATWSAPKLLGAQQVGPAR